MIKKETQGIKNMKVKVESTLEGLVETGLVEDSTMAVDDKGDYVEEGKEVWDELERNFG